MSQYRLYMIQLLADFMQSFPHTNSTICQKVWEIWHLIKWHSASLPQRNDNILWQRKFFYVKISTNKKLAKPFKIESYSQNNNDAGSVWYEWKRRWGLWGWEGKMIIDPWLEEVKTEVFHMEICSTKWQLLERKLSECNIEEMRVSELCKWYGCVLTVMVWTGGTEDRGSSVHLTWK